MFILINLRFGTKPMVSSALLYKTLYYIQKPHPMVGENRLLITNELIEFEKLLVGVQDFMKITDRFKKIHDLYLN